MSATMEPYQTRYVGPPFERAKVHDAMRLGVVTCRPETSLRDVARIMVSYGIHSTVVADLGTDDDRPWGIVSDLDIAAAAMSDLDTQTARDVASTELVTVVADDTLAHAAQLMSEHEVTHLLAVQPDNGEPVGVISALALAAVIAASR